MLAGGRVKVDSNGVTMWCAQAVAVADNVYTCLSRAHPGWAGATLIGELLIVVIVFLFVNAHGREDNVGVGDMADAVKERASSCSKVEVIHNNC